jgi:branched-chain amino acid transport system substrate-binding protein
MTGGFIHSIETRSTCAIGTTSNPNSREGARCAVEDRLVSPFKNRAIHLLILGLLAFGTTLHSAEVDSKARAEIVLGMSTVLSGPAAALGKDMQAGVLAGLERANRAGGVNGRKLRLVALDDGYEPSRTAPNMRQLLDKENVLAVIGNVGTPTSIVAIPIAMEQKTLFFAAFTGAGVLRNKPPDRYVVNYRASYAEEVGTMIDGLHDELGLKLEEIAFFTQRDGYGDAGFDGGVAALKRHGLKDEKAVLHVRYERNTLAVENAVASLILAERPPRAVVMVGAYAPCAKFIQQCREAGVRALFLNVSFVGSMPLAKALGKTDAPVVVTQVVPSPLDTKSPIVREYVADLHLWNPTAAPGFGDLEGYIAARIFIKALEQIKVVPTRENIVDALEGLGEFDIGIGAPLHLGASEHQASHRVWPTILKDGAFVPLQWKDLAGFLKEDSGL